MPAILAPLLIGGLAVGTTVALGNQANDNYKAKTADAAEKLKLETDLKNQTAKEESDAATLEAGRQKARARLAAKPAPNRASTLLTGGLGQINQPAYTGKTLLGS